MKTRNRELGRFGEKLAKNTLINQGYQILAQNFFNKFGEIDIIAMDKDTLVFVEVKVKTGTNYGLPEDMITKSKLNKIKRMADVYTHGKMVKCRIDVVAIVFKENNCVDRLTHYQNVS